MKSKLLGAMGFLTLCLTLGTAEAEAGYYSGWNYHSTYGYHYCAYHYQPQSYHYTIYYPSKPRYYYYYNPYSRVYWGRFDREGKPGQQYSLLAEKDRKEKLADIPEEAFPAPGAMPAVPGATDTTPIAVPPAPPAPVK